MYSTAFALALLSTILAAPAVVESPFGLVSTLSSTNELDGFLVFSNDDGSLWLRNPEDASAIEMLGNMNLEGKVLGLNGTSLFIDDHSALVLSSDNQTDMMINEESVLASSKDSVVMAACPSDGGYQLFDGSSACNGRVNVTLRAVTDGSAPLAEVANNLDIKQHFCCLKSCLRCGGCASHSRPSTCSNGCTYGNWAPNHSAWGPHSGQHGDLGSNGDNSNWNSEGNCAGGNGGSFPVSSPSFVPTTAACLTCGDGTGPVVIGTHVETDTRSTGTHRETDAGPTITGSHVPQYTNGTITTSSPIVTPTFEPIPTQPYYQHDCNEKENTSNSGERHYDDANRACGMCYTPPSPPSSPTCGCQNQYHHSSQPCPQSGAHFCPKNAFCGICGRLPSPKSILCGLCKARPSACADAECNSGHHSCKCSSHCTC